MIFCWVETTVQCVQNGRSSSNFHLKGFVISDLYKTLDTHCIAGNKMQQQISNLCKLTEELFDDDDDDLDDDNDLDDEFPHDDGNIEAFNERKCETGTQVKTKSVKRRTESKEQNKTKKKDVEKKADGSDVDVVDDGLGGQYQC